MITCTGINSGGHAAKGKRQDLKNKQAIAKRERRRETIRDADNFAKTIAAICPEFFT